MNHFYLGEFVSTCKVTFNWTPPYWEADIYIYVCCTQIKCLLVKFKCTIHYYVYSLCTILYWNNVL